MRTTLPIVTGAVLFAALAYFSGQYHTGEIESDLRERTTTALHDGSSSGVEIAASGQTIILRGEVPNEETRKRMQEEASLVWGVSEVQNQLQVTPLLSSEVCAGAVQTVATRTPVWFAAQGSELDAAALASLDRIAGLMTECPQAGFVVKAGSEARAAEVVKYLVSKGTPVSRLTSTNGAPESSVVVFQLR